MASFLVAAVDARCPLCGTLVLSISRSGRVVAADLHPIALGRHGAGGYTLCDDCGILADLPRDLTLN